MIDRLRRIVTAAFSRKDDFVDAKSMRRIRAADTLKQSAREQEEMPRGRRPETVTVPEPAAVPGITSEYTKETPR